MDTPPAPAPAEDPLLILYTRQGCCLCEGLEERLRALGLSAGGLSAGGLSAGTSAPQLTLVDVDGDPELQSRYGLEVPVLAMRGADAAWRELPRVPPRLAGERLAQWLVRQGVALSAADAG